MGYGNRERHKRRDGTGKGKNRRKRDERGKRREREKIERRLKGKGSRKRYEKCGESHKMTTSCFLLNITPFHNFLPLLFPSLSFIHLYSLFPPSIEKGEAGLRERERGKVDDDDAIERSSTECGGWKSSVVRGPVGVHVQHRQCSAPGRRTTSSSSSPARSVSCVCCAVSERSLAAARASVCV